jgi:threonine dehydrogenase-like Zn-dependent dehydrogenase
VTLPGTRPAAPEERDTETTSLLPHLAVALQAWSELGLELGEAAVVSGQGPFAGLLLLVATWRGGTPVLGWTSAEDNPFRVGAPGTESGTPLEIIRATASAQPGFAAVDVGGNPGQIDVLLDAAPRFGRILLAAERMPPLTLDYYNNIHRKGVALLTRRFDFGTAGESSAGKPGIVVMEHAKRILENPEMAELCRAAFAGAADWGNSPGGR